MNYPRLVGVGSYLPSTILTNNDIAKRVETSDEWVIERTGIRQRHIVGPEETAASMGEIAAKRALDYAGVDIQAVDLIVVATSTPDRVFPSTACFIQQRLKITKPIIAFDISAACCGFLYALGTAEQFVRSGASKTALVIGSEAMSRVIDWNDRSTCVLFGDGAGAVVLKQDKNPGIINTRLHSDGNYQDLLFLPNPRSAPHIPDQSSYLQMKGSEVFKLAVNLLNQTVEEILMANQLNKSDIHWLVPHQANLRIIQATAKKLGLSLENVIITVDQHANTSAASIPLALDMGVRSKKIREGDLILLEAIGGGMTWGSSLIRL